MKLWMSPSWRAAVADFLRGIVRQGAGKIKAFGDSTPADWCLEVEAPKILLYKMGLTPFVSRPTRVNK
jgi:hypothetical protein